MAIRNIKRNKNPTEIYRFVNGKKKYIKRVYKIINGKSVIVWDITENAPVSYIYISHYPVTTYQWTQEFNPNGLTVIAVCTDGTSKNITSKCVLSNTDGLITQDRTITITYHDDIGNKDFSLSFSVSCYRYDFEIHLEFQEDTIGLNTVFMESELEVKYFWDTLKNDNWSLVSILKIASDYVISNALNYNYKIADITDNGYFKLRIGVKNQNWKNFSDKPTIVAPPVDCKENIVRVRFSDNFVKIDDNAFKDCINLDWVFIPLSVKEIGFNAFNNTALKKAYVGYDCIIQSNSFPNDCVVTRYNYQYETT